MSYNIALLDASERHLGIEEWPGARHNPAILAMFADAGHAWVKDDETPWCAAYIASLLGEIGLSGTGKLNARSYLDWGQEVAIVDARPGDIVVLWRGSPDGWQGHVAVLVRFEGARMVLRGGNQGSEVSDAAYPMQRLLGIRRADGGAAQDNRPVLRSGTRGRVVMDLQVALRALGYHLGAVDGAFGPVTERAVLAFQRANELQVDGVVGRRTWGALQGAPVAAPERALSEADLRDRGSQTIARADRTQVAQVVGGGAGLAAATGTLAAEISMARAALEGAGGQTGTLADVLPWVLAVLSILGVGVAAYSWWQSRQLKARRVSDARSGAHVGR